MTTSIVVDNVSKVFRYHNHRTLKQVLRARMNGEKSNDSFKAIDDVSFEV